MTPWTADRMGSEEGRGRRQWKEKAEGSLGLLIGCRPSDSMHRWREGGRGQGSHLAEASFPMVTAGHNTRGSDPSMRPYALARGAGQPTLTHRRLLVVVFAGHQLHASRLQFNLFLD